MVRDDPNSRSKESMFSFGKDHSHGHSSYEDDDHLQEDQDDDEECETPTRTLSVLEPPELFHHAHSLIRILPQNMSVRHKALKRKKQKAT